jgi:two-component system, NtrC family, response regulator AtoC
MFFRALSNSEARHNTPPARVLFGRTAEMLSVQRTLESVARTHIPVLIQGESGTGKELCVRLIHERSERAGGKLVKVSCPAIPHALLETELFGYEKGAFTGANSTKCGRVEEADGGTLFLDEVGSLDLGMQSKMLQVLQDGTFMRVGAHETRSIQMSLISVANRDLREQVEEGSFRLDFLYRINAMTVTLPPLRRRLEDLPDLVDYFMEQHARTFGQDPAPLSRSMMGLMRRYDWPGNIRQLDNLIRRYVLVGDEEQLMEELVPEEKTREDIAAEVDVSVPISLKLITKKATHDLERQIILKVLKANSWNRQRTAKWLKISYRSLLYKLNDLGRSDVPKIRRDRLQLQNGKAPTTSSSAPGPSPRFL